MYFNGGMRMKKVEKKQDNNIQKLQIVFPEKALDDIEKIAEDMGIKRTDVVKIAVKKYIDEYKK